MTLLRLIIMALAIVAMQACNKADSPAPASSTSVNTGTLGNIPPGASIILSSDSGCSASMTKYIATYNKTTKHFRIQTSNDSLSIMYVMEIEADITFTQNMPGPFTNYFSISTIHPCHRTITLNKYLNYIGNGSYFNYTLLSLDNKLTGELWCTLQPVNSSYMADIKLKMNNIPVIVTQ